MKVNTKTKTTKDIIRVPKGQKSEVKSKTKDGTKTKSTNKNKKASTSLTVLGDTKVSMKDMRSYFGKQAPTILTMLEMNDNDGALTLLKKRLLQTTVSLVPFAEDIIRNSQSQRGIYQYTTLVSQVRELISDIRADEDRKYVAQSLIEAVLRPAFMEIAQFIITDHHEFRKTTEKHVKSEYTQKFNEKLQALAKQLAEKMMGVYKEAEQKTFNHLKN